MSSTTNNSVDSKDDRSNTSGNSTSINTPSNQTRLSYGEHLASHEANPGPIIPQNITVLEKEEGTKEERLAKAKELNK